MDNTTILEMLIVHYLINSPEASKQKLSVMLVVVMEDVSISRSIKKLFMNTS